MPVWIWWLVGGVATYAFNVHAQRQGALQSIDVALLLVKSAAGGSPQFGQTATGNVQSGAGPLTAESNVPAALQQRVAALSAATKAPDWLVLATEVQSQGYPVLAYSIADRGMVLLEAGQLNLN